jgi:putative salt-induced outer membrane protein YdiY
MKKWIALVVCLPLFVFSDEVQLQDGSLLKGRILSVSEDSLKVETSFSGTIKIDRSLVESFSSDQILFVRLASGAVMPGTISSAESGRLSISGIDGVLNAPMSSVRQCWMEDAQDPETVAREKEAAELRGKWKYEVSAKVSGKSGNTEEKNLGAVFSAVLDRKDDDLKFYGSYDRKETEGDKTTDERKVGMRYNSYARDPWGWYVRQEFENDEFENIRLRSVTGGGLTYRFFKEEHTNLSGNIGLSYRYESYLNGSQATGNVGLDLGLQHFYRMQNLFEIHNDLTYLPSIEDTAKYLLIQKSYVDFPLGNSEMWKVRVSLDNQYNSRPASDRKKLDTTYSGSLVAEWD